MRPVLLRGLRYRITLGLTGTSHGFEPDITVAKHKVALDLKQFESCGSLGFVENFADDSLADETWTNPRFRRTLPMQKGHELHTRMGAHRDFEVMFVPKLQPLVSTDRSKQKTWRLLRQLSLLLTVKVCERHLPYLGHIQ